MNIVKGPITGTEFDDDLPSGRILFALEAMRHFERTPGFAIDMDHYRMKTPEACYACCGGAARSVKQKWAKNQLSFISELTQPGDSYETSLDYARAGEVFWLFKEMRIDLEVEALLELEESVRTRITPYDEDRESFYADLTSLAESLAKLGY